MFHLGLVSLLCVLLAAPTGGQQDASGHDIDGTVEKTMRHYLRDVTELRLTVSSEETTTDLNGNVVHKHHSAHHLIYEAGRTERKEAQSVKIGKATPREWEVDSDVGIFATAYVFIPDQWGKAYVHSAAKLDGEALSVDYRSRDKCSPWRKRWFGLKFNEWCGAGALRLERDGLTPIDASFAAFQVGPDLKSSSVPSYVYHMTFQRIDVHGNSSSFIVPQEVTLTVADKRKRITIRNSYSLTTSDDRPGVSH
jgi:hypothetical protein